MANETLGQEIVRGPGNKCLGYRRFSYCGVCVRLRPGFWLPYLGTPPWFNLRVQPISFRLACRVSCAWFCRSIRIRDSDTNVLQNRQLVINK